MFYYYRSVEIKTNKEKSRETEKSDVWNSRLRLHADNEMLCVRVSALVQYTDARTVNSRLPYYVQQTIKREKCGDVVRLVCTLHTIHPVRG